MIDAFSIRTVKQQIDSVALVPVILSEDQIDMILDAEIFHESSVMFIFLRVWLTAKSIMV